MASGASTHSNHAFLDSRRLLSLQAAISSGAIAKRSRDAVRMERAARSTGSTSRAPRGAQPARDGGGGGGGLEYYDDATDGDGVDGLHVRAKSALDAEDGVPLKGTQGAVTVGDYRRMRARFEKNHAWNRTADALIECHPKTGAVTLLSSRHAERALSAQWAFSTGPQPDDVVPFFPLWMNDTERRTVRSIVHIDAGKPDEFFVPFTFAFETYARELAEGADEVEIAERLEGLGLEFTSEREIAPKADLTERVWGLFTRLMGQLGEPESDTYAYILDYFAHILQRPTENPGIALIFTGGKGVGKDTLCNFIMKYVVGPAFTFSYNSTHQFFEKHDVAHMGKLIVKIEEADPAVLKQPSNAAALRARVTAENSMANPKGLTAYQQPNYTRTLMTSNAVDPTGLNVDGRERRYLLAPFGDALADRCAPGACGKHGGPCAFKDFWEPFHREVMTPLGGYVVATKLLERDISSRVIFKLPYNEFLAVIAAHDSTPEELFVEDWRKEAIEELEGGGDVEEVDSKTLYERFRSWMAINAADAHLPTSHAFFQRMAKLVRDNKLKMRVGGGRKAHYRIA